jgi:hypothetical protein
MQFYLQSRSVFFWLGSRRSASGFSAYPVNRLTVRPCSPSCGFDIGGWMRCDAKPQGMSSTMPVCTENSHPDVMVMNPAEDRV